MTRALVRLGLAVAVLLSVTGATATRAWASCLRPTLLADPSTVSPGDQVTITGRGFMAECRDTIMPTTSTTLPPVQPITGIELVFVQGGRQTPLATVDANADFTLSATVRIPADASDGAASIAARVASNDIADPAEIVVNSNNSGPRVLARTGTDHRIAVLGGALVVLGFGLGVGRRRRTPPDPGYQHHYPG